jgi:uroporphyrinogen decarboxylase
MDSRERTFLAIAREKPDRIPVDFWASAATSRKLQAEVGLDREAFLDAHDVDLRYVAGPRYAGPPLARTAGGVECDIWGVSRKSVQVGESDSGERYEELAGSPLAAATLVEQVLEYPHWPSADWFQYDDVERQCDAVRRKGRVVVFMGDRLNRVAQLKPAMYIRGIEQILADLAMAPEIARAIFGRIREFYLAYLERILAAARGKIDIVLTGDDFGAQNGLLVSPAMWDEYLREGFVQYVGLIHAYGAKAMHHTCGSVAPLVDRLADCGLDVLQSLQPEAKDMAPRDLKARFGARIAFEGGVSIQRTMPFGSPADVRREAAELAQALGAGGGYIFGTSHNIQADTPVANVLALMKAYRDFGRS